MKVVEWIGARGRWARVVAGLGLGVVMLAVALPLELLVEGSSLWSPLVLSIVAIAVVRRGVRRGSRRVFTRFVEEELHAKPTTRTVDGPARRRITELTRRGFETGPVVELTAASRATLGATAHDAELGATALVWPLCTQVVSRLTDGRWLNTSSAAMLPIAGRIAQWERTRDASVLTKAHLDGLRVLARQGVFATAVDPAGVVDLVTELQRADQAALAGVDVDVAIRTLQRSYRRPARLADGTALVA